MLMRYVYLAGIIDGEGTITINRHSRNTKGQWHLKPMLRVADRNKELIEYLVRNFGGSCTKYQRKESKPIYRWTVHAIKHINEILIDVCPYLIVKRLHADILIEFTKSRMRAIAVHPRSPYSDWDVDCHLNIRKLNVR